MSKKLLLTFFISTAIFLFLPTEVFASFSITEVSPSIINSSDDIIVVTATVSGLRNNPQYLQIGFTLSGGTTKLFGITKNNEDEWYYYKSSPTASDLTSTFYTFTHDNGSWSGQVSGKIDIDHSGYYGPGDYKLRLYKYTISSSQSVEWGSAITVNISPPPTPTSTPTPEPTDTPAPTSSPTLIPTPTSRPTSIPTPKQTVTPKPTVKIASSSGEVLGELEATLSAFYPYEATNGAEEKEATSSAKNKLWPKIFLGIGLLLVFASVFWGWYNFHK